MRLPYLGVVDAFATLHLLTMSDRDKDAEILALRHQITLLERAIVIPEGAEYVKRGIFAGCWWFWAALIASPSVGFCGEWVVLLVGHAVVGVAALQLLMG
ncbi:hypothetical protein [Streptomyces mirabilis]|uniref:hypothetical protein n=1 Tax=Streptomyces mirabilis TaxID=68239 RepID=UPI002E36604F|nr:hypothetical protein [Streptomyces mirabilis]